MRLGEGTDHVALLVRCRRTVGTASADTATGHTAPGHTAPGRTAPVDWAVDSAVGATVDVVVRTSAAPPGPERAAAVRWEARLLEALPAVVPVATPRVLAVDEAAGVLVTTRVPGRPLGGAAATGAVPSAAAAALAPDLVRVLHRLHGAPGDLLRPLLPVDRTDPADYLAEVVDCWPEVAAAVPAAFRGAVERHLGTPPPPPASRLVPCHADLGAEHLLVDGRGRLSGIVDVSDAAVTDPALDVARVLRDLGDDVAARVLRRHPVLGDGDRARIVFHARCALLEDLVHGLRTGQEGYVLAALARLDLFDG